MLAVRAAEPGPEGRCADDAHCQSGACGYFDGIGRCGRGCDPRLGHYQCPEVKAASWIRWATACAARTATRGPTRSVSRVVKLVSACTASARTGAAPWCGGDGWCPADHLCDGSVGEPGVCRYEPGAGGGQQTGLGCACGSASGVGLEWLLFAALVRRRRVKLRS